MTQMQLADAVRSTQTTICCVECDKTSTGFFTFIEIARFFGVSLDYLAYGENHGTANNH